MAVSTFSSVTSGSQSCKIDEKEKVFQEISEQFLQMVPIRRMRWNNAVIDEDNLNPEIQKKVLQLTVLHPSCKKYPASINYQRTFMKTFLHKLEQCEVEICDEIYEVYTSLLSTQEDEDDSLCYKTYTLPSGNTVSLQESVHLISQGTTGLSTWQAAQNLAEYCLENKQLFHKRKILELGSGLGLSGIVVCATCSPQNYIFSDCHPQVLYLLSKNIELNLSCVSSPFHKHNQNQKEEHERDSKIMKNLKRKLSLNADSMSSNFEVVEICMSATSPSEEEFSNVEEELSRDLSTFSLNSKHWITNKNGDLNILRSANEVCLACLDWDNIEGSSLEDLSTEVILAADVVYDLTVIPSLVNLLDILLSRPGNGNNKPIGIISSTIRNEDTRDNFLIALGSSGIIYQILEPPRNRIFHYDRSVPIEILKVYKE